MRTTRSDGLVRIASLARSAASQLGRRDLSSFQAYLHRWVRPQSVRRTARAYRRTFRLTLGQWLRYHQSDVVFERCTWMGVRTWKSPLDAWIYQEILHEVRPDVVLEIGSAAGGSTLYLAHLLDLIGQGTVVSVDIDRSRFQAKHPRIVTVTGPSSSAATLEKVAALCEGKRALVIHDADHRKAQVLEDLRAYAPFVSVGSYLIVEDGIIDVFRPHEALGVTYEGPLAAIEEFLRSSDWFEVDDSRERYLLTYNPRGFLRRVR
ncbi:MAG TPA: CmcI family methyltransferase [Acidimicrobiales bacterium]|nr:CmcI family methyltransferase [Acidimicrobiales bacterium]